MNDPLDAPCFKIMAVATMMFSPPLSPRTRQGHPHTLVDPMNTSRTVCGKLFPATLMPVTCNYMRELDTSKSVIGHKLTMLSHPSMDAWTMKPHGPSLWWPSMCHMAFGRGETYVRRLTVRFFRRTCWTPSTREIEASRQSRWIRHPFCKRCPRR